MVTISPLAPADFDEWNELWQGYLTFYASELDAETTRLTFDRLVDGTELRGVIARDDTGTAVGLVHWLTHPATWTARDYCYLEDLYVAPTSRDGGVGRALIAHVRAWAEAHGSAKVYWLTAETNTAARGLYEKVATKSGFIHYQISL